MIEASTATFADQFFGDARVAQWPKRYATRLSWRVQHSLNPRLLPPGFEPTPTSEGVAGATPTRAAI